MKLVSGRAGSAVLMVAFGLFGTMSVAADDQVKLTGCLIRGSNDGGYLLVNSPAGTPAASTDAPSRTPGSVGTAGVFANVFYWLDKDDFLQPHVGHYVEIEGDLKEDIESGQMKIERKAEWTELEVKSDGRTLKAEVPNASVVAGPDDQRKVAVLVRRVDADKLTMLAANCR
jgi:hypothetical protein